MEDEARASHGEGSRSGRREAGGGSSLAVVPAAPAVHPVIAAILRILPLLDLAILGLGALAFLSLYWPDRTHSPEYASGLSRKEDLLLAAGHGILGVIALASSILLENALAIRLAPRGEGVAPVSLCILLAFLGFSSFGLALAAYRSRPAPVLSRYHPFLSAVATVALLLLIPFTPVAVRRSTLLLALGAVTFASTALAFWQHHNLITLEGGRQKGAGREAGGRRTTIGQGTAGRILNLPSSFPRDLLNRFSDPEVVGSGGVSRVFRARRKDSGRVVAVKVPLSLDEMTGMAFLKEMRTWEELNHENIARILGANILPVPYVEMEFFPRSLEELGKPLDARTATRIVAGIARGLAFAHARGIIHRDLKPGNVLVTDDLEPKIGDWGLSRFLGGATATDISGFSPSYAAPEQVDPGRYGKPDERTDIYGAGGIFYELVTGRPPFTGEGLAEITAKILNSEPPPPSALNPAADAVEGIIMRCLEKDPGKRYQRAGDLEEDLLGFLGDDLP
ncbi:MAG TPA: serine/threonine-protein kinase [Methanomicrobiales archaeon]|nr:serine/threonine-protein kinase [Methanomicrobiales archaeon]